MDAVRRVQLESAQGGLVGDLPEDVTESGLGDGSGRGGKPAHAGDGEVVGGRVVDREDGQVGSHMVVDAMRPIAAQVGDMGVEGR